MIERNIYNKIEYYLKKFPIVSLIGVRQCGKTTLLREKFKDWTYVSLEDPDIREFAESDGRGFLSTYSNKCILDEVQRVPKLFSYLQTKVDENETMGQYILSGSHNFLLMQSISQSLAGRVAILTLTPLSYKELFNANVDITDIDSIMQKGFYPAIYSRDIDASEYFPNYFQTYIERDVRLLQNIVNVNDFVKFVKVLATRSGHILNYTDLSDDCNISVATVKSWLSILIQSYIVYELQPYYNNFSKRLIKSPKVYFYDTGLLCNLLKINNKEQLVNSDYYGSIFETMIVSEFLKKFYENAKIPNMYYWRDTNQNEIDLIIEDESVINAYEIKASKTADRKFLKNMIKFSEFSGIPKSNMSCIYTGEQNLYGENGNFINFKTAMGVSE